MMINTNSLLLKVENAIAAYQLPAWPNGLYTPIEYILSLGGKRIRPVLLLATCQAYQGDVEKALAAALGYEVFHNFTLLHDDIMDASQMRRGKPTANVVWGDNAAILSGDAMLIKAYQIMSSVVCDDKESLLNLFNKTALEVCEGQQEDMNFEKREDVQLAEYIEMIRLKTAVLLAACLKTGALMASASNEDADNMYDYGINLGLAFQLRDDYLDAFGDSAVFGKKIGGDILCGKKTFLSIMALEQAQGDDLKLLKECINPTSTLDAQYRINSVLAIYQKYGIDKACEEAIQNYFNKSVVCIKNTQLSDNEKDFFISFSKETTSRVK